MNDVLKRNPVRGTMLWISIVLSLGLLVGCAKSTNAPAGNHAHEGHNTADSEIKAVDSTELLWNISPVKPQAKSDYSLTMRVQDTKGKAVIEKFDLNHEKYMHLIVVSKDLSYFQHVHPNYDGKGVFELKNQFPSGGEYKLFADYKPTDAEAAVKSKWVSVEGTAAAAVPISPDQNRTKVVDGKNVTLSYDNLKAGQDVELTFTITDEQTKKPVIDLQPYLGAVGHVVVLSEDAEQYLHVHPVDEKAKGPDAKFMTNFPSSGMYKLWGQFQHKGQVFTVPFVVKVT
jgi:hypothetical protein